MKGYSPKLPLTYDNIDGSYTMNLNIVDSIKQDLKMLLLTSPGERMMHPEYGVGIRMYLFSQNQENMSSLLEDRITKQVETYMEFISINSIDIQEDEMNLNGLNVSISYTIPFLNTQDVINLSLESN